MTAVIAAVLSPAAVISPAFGLTLGQTITTVWTDFGGVWKSDTSTVVPDNDHNLLAFTAGGTVYSTGANDGALAGVTFTPSTWKALPVEGLPNTASTNYFVARGGAVGSPSFTSPGFSPNPSSADLATFLTSGTRGLNLGSGLTNIPAGTTLTFNLVGGIATSSIADGIPDILITQIANPASTKDRLKFEDSSNNLVGTIVEVDQNASPSIARPSSAPQSFSARYYTIPGATLATGFSFPVPSDVRMRSYELSEFGITSDNAASVSRLVWIAGGSSDPAFFAYNEASISAVGGSTVVGSATTTLAAIADTPLATGTVTASATNSASLTLTYSTTTAGVCTVDSASGVVTLVSVGSCTIRAGHPQTQVGSTIYPASSDTTSFSVLVGNGSPGPSDDAPATTNGTTPTTGAIALDLTGPPGGPSERATADIVGTNLTPGATYRLTLGNPQQVLFEGRVATSGSFVHRVSLPAGLASQTWVLALGVGGGSLALHREFTVGEGSVMVDYGTNALGMPPAAPERLAYTGYGSSGLPWWASLSFISGLLLVLYSLRATRLYEEELLAHTPVAERGPWEILATPISVPGIAYTPGSESTGGTPRAQGLAETIAELDRAMSRIIAVRISSVSSRMGV